MYIGRRRPLESGIPTVDEFTGTGSQTAFTMSRSVSHERQVLVMQGGAVQDYENFSVSCATLTFTTAPADEVYIQVIHFLGVQSYFQLLDNSIGVDQLVNLTPVVQFAETHSSTPNASTTVMPIDDSVPQQSTEGSQFLSLAFTPVNASNNLLIHISGWGVTAGGYAMSIALYVDSTENALAAWSPGLGSNNFSFCCTYFENAASTSARTYKAFHGPSSAGTTTISDNRLGTAEYYIMTITEYSVAL